MSYGSPDDVRRVYPKVYTSGFTPEEVQDFLDRAAGKIDAWLCRRYATPFTPPIPVIIKDIESRLALIDIVDRQPMTPDWVVRMIERAWEDLKMLANGTLGIPGVSESGSDTILVNNDGAIPVFGRFPSLSERDDPNLVEEEEESRKT